MTRHRRNDQTQGETRADDDAVARQPRKLKPFARDARLRTRRQLDYVKARGTRRPGRYCVVAVAEPGDGQRRVAIITSRRYSPRAVTRNRARRLLREAYRLLLPGLKPAWIVLIPRQAMQTAKLNDLLPEMQRALTGLGVLGQTAAGSAGAAEEARS